MNVAKRSSFVDIIDGRGKKIENREIPTDKDSYRQYFRSWAKKPVRVAVEAGGHTRWSYDAITKLGIDVYVVNPHKVKVIAESKRKTDKVDVKYWRIFFAWMGCPEKSMSQKVKAESYGISCDPATNSSKAQRAG